MFTNSQHQQNFSGTLAFIFARLHCFVIHSKEQKPLSNCFNNVSISRASHIAFLLEWAQISDLDFGLIQQNISTKKASFQY